MENIYVLVFFVKIVGLRDTAYLKWNPTTMLYQKFDEGVVCNIEISKKSSHDDMKENLRSKQSRLNYVNKNKKTEKRTHKISNLLY